MPKMTGYVNIIKHTLNLDNLDNFIKKKWKNLLFLDC